MAKVLYFNIDDTLDYEKKLLNEWGIDDVELLEIKDRDYKKTFLEYAKETDADGLVVEYDEVTREVFDACPNLKIVSLQSIGYNNIDVAAATDHKVCVCNIPGFCAPEVAAHTVALTLDLLRKVTFYDRSVHQGKWDPLYGYTLHRPSTLTFGCVFFGQIPKLVVPVIRALGMRVLVYAPTKTKEYLAEYGCEKAETLDGLLAESDVVSLHCPLIQGVTYHLMGDHEFDVMKESAVLVNTARGSVVDEAALVRALKTGKIRAAAVDVIEDEMSEKSELFDLENCVLTPHAAFISKESFYEGRRRCLEHLVQRLSKKRDGKPTDVVNGKALGLF